MPLRSNSKASADEQPPSRTGAETLVRQGAIGIIIAGIFGAFAYTGGWFSPPYLTPARFIDTFEKVNGIHPGFRRNHAKGVCVTGFFESNGNGIRLSKAAIFELAACPRSAVSLWPVASHIFPTRPELSAARRSSSCYSTEKNGGRG